MIARLALCGLALLCAPAAFAQERFTPSDLDSLSVSRPVEVMVLGTPHLSAAPDSFTTDMLAPVLDELEAFAPTHIAIEAVSAEHVRFLVAEAARYPGLADQFARTARRLMELAAETTDLNPVEAELAAMESLPAAGDAARRDLAALFARAGDPNSAVTQWLQLPTQARVPGGPVSASLAEALDTLAASRNENVSIGATLAARLGHERVWPMDDWMAGDLALDIFPALSAAIGADPALSGVLTDPAIVEVNSAREQLTSAEGVMAVYRLYNDPQALASRAAAEWGAFLRAETATELARARIAAWEARNLRMAAHILEATRGQPGARVLVIVGASHKPYLEAALDDLSLVRIVDF